jgi:hypothetical protein
VRIHLCAEHAGELELAHLALEPSDIALDFPRGGFIVLELGQLEQLCRVAQSVTGAIELIELAGQAGALAAELLGALRLAPDRRILKLAIDLFETFPLAVVLKETPSRSATAPRDLSTCA